MVEPYGYFARCNRAVNAQMIGVIEGAGDDLFNRPIEGYFSSVGEILTHCYRADLSWLSAFRNVREFSIYTDPVFERPPGWGERLFETLAEYKTRRSALDELILRFADELEPADLDKTGTRVNRRGETQRFTLGKAVIHMFNHQTHHRGQVSQILDELGIENDYSNMISVEIV